MKKLTFGAVLLAAAMVSSCSKDNVNEVLPSSDNVDAISINTAVGVTRATDTSTTSLQSGVTLYYYDSTATAVNGSIAFSYSGGWQAATETWDTFTTFPVYFYSVHNGTAAQDLTVATGGASATITANSGAFTVESTPANQVDLVYYASKLTEMPTGGTISAVHKHALSKVTFAASNGEKALAIASLKFVDVNSVATPTFSASDVTWASLGTPVTYSVITAAADANAVTVAKGDSGTAVTAISSESMIIIPQTFSYTSSDFSATTDSYIEVIYRSADSSGNDVIGYSSVTNYPDYASAATSEDTNYTGALYTKVLFPIPTATTLAYNTEYAITLGLGATGTSGGVSMSSDYVDKDGNAVTITLQDNSTVEDPLPDEGDDVTPDAEFTSISINPTAGSWASGAAVESK